MTNYSKSTIIHITLFILVNTIKSPNSFNLKSVSITTVKFKNTQIRNLAPNCETGY